MNMEKNAESWFFQDTFLFATDWKFDESPKIPIEGFA